MKDTYTLPAGYDAHVHLRDGKLSEAVTPTSTYAYLLEFISA